MPLGADSELTLTNPISKKIAGIVASCCNTGFALAHFIVLKSQWDEMFIAKNLRASQRGCNFYSLSDPLGKKCLNCLGVIPTYFLNAALNADLELNPASYARPRKEKC
jgi:hypothetical protein